MTPRLHKSAQSKPCRFCNEIYFRKRDVCLTRWLQSRFCSLKCLLNSKKKYFSDYLKTSVLKTSSCWLWVGSRDSAGYGVVKNHGTGKSTKAHRASWQYFNGAIPNNLFVLHKCDVRNCINPSHLFLGTQADNMLDCKKKGRIVAIPRPGELNPMARLNKKQVEQILKLKQKGEAQNKLAKKFNVSPMTISRVVNGQTWRNIYEQFNSI